MSYKPSDVVYGTFVTQRFDTGVATDGDSLPTAKVVHNGAYDSAVTVTVTKIDTGTYSFTFTIPSGYATGDAVQAYASAVVNSVAAKGVIFDAVLDRYRLSDAPAMSATLSSADSQYLHQGTAQGAGGGNNTIQLATSASAVNNIYVGCPIRLISGTGGGQPDNICTAYDGGTKIATVQNNWIGSNPDSTTVAGVKSIRSPKLDSNLAVTAGTVTPTVNANILTVLGTTPTAAQALSTDSGGRVNVNPDQMIPTTGNTAHSVADCMNAARAQGFGNWAITAGVLYLYADDGTTVVRSFTLDKLVATTSRVKAS